MSTENGSNSTSTENMGGEGQQEELQGQEGQQTGEGGQAGEGADQAGQEGAEGADKRGNPERRLERLQRKIGQKTAITHQQAQEIEALRRENEALRRRGGAGADDGDAGNGGNDERITVREAQELAQRMTSENVRIQTIANGVQRVLEDGTKRFEGFTEKAAKVGDILPVLDARSKPTPFIEVVASRANGADVLAYLADNPDEAEDLSELGVEKMRERVIELSVELKHRPTKPKLSKAPAPLDPVKGRSQRSETSASAVDELAAIRRAR